MDVPVYTDAAVPLREIWFYEVDLNKIPECGVLMFEGGCANCPCKDKPECKCPKEGK